MSPQRRAELTTELDVLTREALRIASGPVSVAHHEANAQLDVLRQVAKVLHIELAVSA